MLETLSSRFSDALSVRPTSRTFWLHVVVRVIQLLSLFQLIIPIGNVIALFSLSAGSRFSSVERGHVHLLIGGLNGLTYMYGTPRIVYPTILLSLAVFLLLLPYLLLLVVTLGLRGTAFERGISTCAWLFHLVTTLFSPFCMKMAYFAVLVEVKVMYFGLTVSLVGYLVYIFTVFVDNVLALPLLTPSARFAQTYPLGALYFDLLVAGTSIAGPWLTAWPLTSSGIAICVSILLLIICIRMPSLFGNIWLDNMAAVSAVMLLVSSAGYMVSSFWALTIRGRFFPFGVQIYGVPLAGLLSCGVLWYMHARRCALIIPRLRAVGALLDGFDHRLRQFGVEYHHQGNRKVSTDGYFLLIKRLLHVTDLDECSLQRSSAREALQGLAQGLSRGLTGSNSGDAIAGAQAAQPQTQPAGASLSDPSGGLAGSLRGGEHQANSRGRTWVGIDYRSADPFTQILGGLDAHSPADYNLSLLLDRSRIYESNYEDHLGEAEGREAWAEAPGQRDSTGYTSGMGAPVLTSQSAQTGSERSVGLRALGRQEELGGAACSAGPGGAAGPEGHASPTQSPGTPSQSFFSPIRDSARVLPGRRQTVHMGATAGRPGYVGPSDLPGLAPRSTFLGRPESVRLRVQSSLTGLPTVSLRTLGPGSSALRESQAVGTLTPSFRRNLAQHGEATASQAPPELTPSTTQGFAVLNQRDAAEAYFRATGTGVSEPGGADGHFSFSTSALPALFHTAPTSAREAPLTPRSGGLQVNGDLVASHTHLVSSMTSLPRPSIAGSDPFPVQPANLEEDNRTQLTSDGAVRGITVETTEFWRQGSREALQRLGAGTYLVPEREWADAPMDVLSASLEPLIHLITHYPFKLRDLHAASSCLQRLLLQKSAADIILEARSLGFDLLSSEVLMRDSACSNLAVNLLLKQVECGIESCLKYAWVESYVTVTSSQYVFVEPNLAPVAQPAVDPVHRFGVSSFSATSDFLQGSPRATICAAIPEERRMDNAGRQHAEGAGAPDSGSLPLAANRQVGGRPSSGLSPGAIQNASLPASRAISAAAAGGSLALPSESNRATLPASLNGALGEPSASTEDHLVPGFQGARGSAHSAGGQIDKAAGFPASEATRRRADGLRLATNYRPHADLQAADDLDEAVDSDSGLTASMSADTADTTDMMLVFGTGRLGEPGRLGSPGSVTRASSAQEVGNDEGARPNSRGGLATAGASDSSLAALAERYSVSQNQISGGNHAEGRSRSVLLDAVEAKRIGLDFYAASYSYAAHLLTAADFEFPFAGFRSGALFFTEEELLSYSSAGGRLFSERISEAVAPGELERSGAARISSTGGVFATTAVSTQKARDSLASPQAGFSGTPEAGDAASQVTNPKAISEVLLAVFRGQENAPGKSTKAWHGSSALDNSWSDLLGGAAEDPHYTVSPEEVGATLANKPFIQGILTAGSGRNGGHASQDSLMRDAAQHISAAFRNSLNTPKNGRKEGEMSTAASTEYSLFFTRISELVERSSALCAANSILAGATPQQLYDALLRRRTGLMAPNEGHEGSWFTLLGLLMRMRSHEVLLHDSPSKDFRGILNKLIFSLVCAVDFLLSNSFALDSAPHISFLSSKRHAYKQLQARYQKVADAISIAESMRPGTVSGVSRLSALGGAAGSAYRDESRGPRASQPLSSESVLTEKPPNPPQVSFPALLVTRIVNTLCCWRIRTIGQKLLSALSDNAYFMEGKLAQKRLDILDKGLNMDSLYFFLDRLDVVTGDLSSWFCSQDTVRVYLSQFGADEVTDFLLQEDVMEGLVCEQMALVSLLHRVSSLVNNVLFLIGRRFRLHGAEAMELDHGYAAAVEGSFGFKDFHAARPAAGPEKGDSSQEPVLDSQRSSPVVQVHSVSSDTQAFQFAQAPQVSRGSKASVRRANHASNPSASQILRSLFQARSNLLPTNVHGSSGKVMRQRAIEHHREATTALFKTRAYAYIMYVYWNSDFLSGDTSSSYHETRPGLRGLSAPRFREKRSHQIKKAAPGHKASLLKESRAGNRFGTAFFGSPSPPGLLTSSDSAGPGDDEHAVPMQTYYTREDFHKILRLYTLEQEAFFRHYREALRAYFEVLSEQPDSPTAILDIEHFREDFDQQPMSSTLHYAAFKAFLARISSAPRDTLTLAEQYYVFLSSFLGAQHIYEILGPLGHLDPSTVPFSRMAAVPLESNTDTFLVQSLSAARRRAFLPCRQFINSERMYEEPVMFRDALLRDLTESGSKLLEDLSRNGAFEGEVGSTQNAANVVSKTLGAAGDLLSTNGTERTHESPADPGRRTASRRLGSSFAPMSYTSLHHAADGADAAKGHESAQITHVSTARTVGPSYISTMTAPILASRQGSFQFSTAMQSSFPHREEQHTPFSRQESSVDDHQGLPGFSGSNSVFSAIDSSTAFSDAMKLHSLANFDLYYYIFVMSHSVSHARAMFPTFVVSVLREVECCPECAFSTLGLCGYHRELIFQTTKPGPSYRDLYRFLPSESESDYIIRLHDALFLPCRTKKAVSVERALLSIRRIEGTTSRVGKVLRCILLSIAQFSDARVLNSVSLRWKSSTPKGHGEKQGRYDEETELAGELAEGKDDRLAGRSDNRVEGELEGSKGNNGSTSGEDSSFNIMRTALRVYDFYISRNGRNAFQRFLRGPLMLVPYLSPDEIGEEPRGTGGDRDALRQQRGVGVAPRSSRPGSVESSLPDVHNLAAPAPIFRGISQKHELRFVQVARRVFSMLGHLVVMYCVLTIFLSVIYTALERSYRANVQTTSDAIQIIFLLSDYPSDVGISHLFSHIQQNDEKLDGLKPLVDYMVASGDTYYIKRVEEFLQQFSANLSFRIPQGRDSRMAWATSAGTDVYRYGIYEPLSLNRSSTESHASETFGERAACVHTSVLLRNSTSLDMDYMLMQPRDNYEGALRELASQLPHLAFRGKGDLHPLLFLWYRLAEIASGFKESAYTLLGQPYLEPGMFLEPWRTAHTRGQLLLHTAVLPIAEPEFREDLGTSAINVLPNSPPYRHVLYQVNPLYRRLIAINSPYFSRWALFHYGTGAGGAQVERKHLGGVLASELVENSLTWPFSVSQAAIYNTHVGLQFFRDFVAAIPHFVTASITAGPISSREASQAFTPVSSLFFSKDAAGRTSYEELYDMLYGYRQHYSTSYNIEASERAAGGEGDEETGSSGTPAGLAQGRSLMRPNTSVSYLKLYSEPRKMVSVPGTSFDDPLGKLGSGPAFAKCSTLLNQITGALSYSRRSYMTQTMLKPEGMSLAQYTKLIHTAMAMYGISNYQNVISLILIATCLSVFSVSVILAILRNPLRTIDAISQDVIFEAVKSKGDLCLVSLYSSSLFKRFRTAKSNSYVLSVLENIRRHVGSAYTSQETANVSQETTEIPDGASAANLSDTGGSSLGPGGSSDAFFLYDSMSMEGIRRSTANFADSRRGSKLRYSTTEAPASVPTQPPSSLLHNVPVSASSESVLSVTPALSTSFARGSFKGTQQVPALGPSQGIAGGPSGTFPLLGTANLSVAPPRTGSFRGSTLFPGLHSGNAETLVASTGPSRQLARVAQADHAAMSVSAAPPRLGQSGSFVEAIGSPNQASLPNSPDRRQSQWRRTVHDREPSRPRGSTSSSFFVERTPTAASRLREGHAGGKGAELVRQSQFHAPARYRRVSFAADVRAAEMEMRKLVQQARFFNRRFIAPTEAPVYKIPAYGTPQVGRPPLGLHAADVKGLGPSQSVNQLLALPVGSTASSRGEGFFDLPPALVQGAGRGLQPAGGSASSNAAAGGQPLRFGEHTVDVASGGTGEFGLVPSSLSSRVSSQGTSPQGTTARRQILTSRLSSRAPDGSIRVHHNTPVLDSGTATPVSSRHLGMEPLALLVESGAQARESPASSSIEPGLQDSQVQMQGAGARPAPGIPIESFGSTSFLVVGDSPGGERTPQLGLQSTPHARSVRRAISAVGGNTRLGPGEQNLPASPSRHSREAEDQQRASGGQSASRFQSLPGIMRRSNSVIGPRDRHSLTVAGFPGQVRISDDVTPLLEGGLRYQDRGESANTFAYLNSILRTALAVRDTFYTGSGRFSSSPSPVHASEDHNGAEGVHLSHPAHLAQSQNVSMLHQPDSSFSMGDSATKRTRLAATQPGSEADRPFSASFAFPARGHAEESPSLAGLRNMLVAQGGGTHRDPQWVQTSALTTARCGWAAQGPRPPADQSTALPSGPVSGTVGRGREASSSDSASSTSSLDDHIFPRPTEVEARSGRGRASSLTTYRRPPTVPPLRIGRLAQVQQEALSHQDSTGDEENSEERPSNSVPPAIPSIKGITPTTEELMEVDGQDEPSGDPTDHQSLTASARLSQLVTVFRTVDGTEYLPVLDKRYSVRGSNAHEQAGRACSGPSGYSSLSLAKSASPSHRSGRSTHKDRSSRSNPLSPYGSSRRGTISQDRYDSHSSADRSCDVGDGGPGRSLERLDIFSGSSMSTVLSELSPRHHAVPSLPVVPEAPELRLPASANQIGATALQEKRRPGMPSRVSLSQGPDQAVLKPGSLNASPSHSGTSFLAAMGGLRAPRTSADVSERLEEENLTVPSQMISTGLRGDLITSLASLDMEVTRTYELGDEKVTYALASPHDCTGCKQKRKRTSVFKAVLIYLVFMFVFAGLAAVDDSRYHRAAAFRAYIADWRDSSQGYLDIVNTLVSSSAAAAQFCLLGRSWHLSSWERYQSLLRYYRDTGLFTSGFSKHTSEGLTDVWRSQRVLELQAIGAALATACPHQSFYTHSRRRLLNELSLCPHSPYCSSVGSLPANSSMSAEVNVSSILPKLNEYFSLPSAEDDAGDDPSTALMDTPLARYLSNQSITPVYGVVIGDTSTCQEFFAEAAQLNGEYAIVAENALMARGQMIRESYEFSKLVEARPELADDPYIQIRSLPILSLLVRKLDQNILVFSDIQQDSENVAAYNLADTSEMVIHTIFVLFVGAASILALCFLYPAKPRLIGIVIGVLSALAFAMAIYIFVGASILRAEIRDPENYKYSAEFKQAYDAVYSKVTALKNLMQRLEIHSDLILRKQTWGDSGPDNLVWARFGIGNGESDSPPDGLDSGFARDGYPASWPVDLAFGDAIHRVSKARGESAIMGDRDLFGLTEKLMGLNYSEPMLRPGLSRGAVEGIGQFFEDKSGASIGVVFHGFSSHVFSHKVSQQPFLRNFTNLYLDSMINSMLGRYVMQTRENGDFRYGAYDIYDLLLTGMFPKEYSLGCAVVQGLTSVQALSNAQIEVIRPGDSRAALARNEEGVVEHKKGGAAFLASKVVELFEELESVSTARVTKSRAPAPPICRIISLVLMICLVPFLFLYRFLLSRTSDSELVARLRAAKAGAHMQESALAVRPKFIVIVNRERHTPPTQAFADFALNFPNAGDAKLAPGPPDARSMRDQTTAASERLASAPPSNSAETTVVPSNGLPPGGSLRPQTASVSRQTGLSTLLQDRLADYQGGRGSAYYTYSLVSLEIMDDSETFAAFRLNPEFSGAVRDLLTRATATSDGILALLQNRPPFVAIVVTGVPGPFGGRANAANEHVVVYPAVFPLVHPCGLCRGCVDALVADAARMKMGRKGRVQLDKSLRRLRKAISVVSMDRLLRSGVPGVSILQSALTANQPNLVRQPSTSFNAQGPRRVKIAHSRASKPRLGSVVSSVPRAPSLTWPEVSRTPSRVMSRADSMTAEQSVGAADGASDTFEHDVAALQSGNNGPGSLADTSIAVEGQYDAARPKLGLSLTVGGGMTSLFRAKADGFAGGGLAPPPASELGESQHQSVRRVPGTPPLPVGLPEGQDRESRSVAAGDAVDEQTSSGGSSNTGSRGGKLGHGDQSSLVATQSSSFRMLAPPVSAPSSSSEQSSLRIMAGRHTHQKYSFWSWPRSVWPARPPRRAGPSGASLMRALGPSYPQGVGVDVGRHVSASLLYEMQESGLSKASELVRRGALAKSLVVLRSGDPVCSIFVPTSFSRKWELKLEHDYLDPGDGRADGDASSKPRGGRSGGESFQSFSERGPSRSSSAESQAISGTRDRFSLQTFWRMPRGRRSRLSYFRRSRWPSVLLALFYVLCGFQVIFMLYTIIPQVAKLEIAMEGLLGISQIQEFAMGLDISVQTMADLVVERRGVDHQVGQISAILQSMPDVVSLAQSVQGNAMPGIYQYLQELGDVASRMLYATRGAVAFNGTSGPAVLLNSERVADVAEYLRKLDTYNKINHNLVQSLRRAHNEIMQSLESGFRIPVPMMLANIVFVVLALLVLRQSILWLLHRDIVRLGAASGLLNIRG